MACTVETQTEGVVNYRGIPIEAHYHNRHIYITILQYMFAAETCFNYRGIPKS